MSVINVTNVTVLDNPCLFTNPLQFEIQYECLQPLANGRRAHRTFEPRPRSPKALK